MEEERRLARAWEAEHMGGGEGGAGGGAGGAGAGVTGGAGAGAGGAGPMSEEALQEQRDFEAACRASMLQDQDADYRDAQAADRERGIQRELDKVRSAEAEAAMRGALELRYRLLPFVYSLAHQASVIDRTPLPFYNTKPWRKFTVTSSPGTVAGPSNARK